jgi:hypothetical protein
MSTNVDIKDFSLEDRVQLLWLLVNGSRKTSPIDNFYELPMLEAVKRGYIENCRGVAIKMNLTEDSLCPDLYELEAFGGKGAVQIRIDYLREHRGMKT